MTTLQFDNRLRQQLPGDSEQGPRRREVRAAWSTVMPTPVAAPRLLAYSADVAQRLGLDEAEINSAQFAEVFAGNALYPGMQPWAVNYGGHQFDIGPASWVTAGRFRWARQSGSMAVATSCSSRAQARPLIRAVPMAGRSCARRSANSCAAKRCIIWVCRPRVR